VFGEAVRARDGASNVVDGRCPKVIQLDAFDDAADVLGDDGRARARCSEKPYARAMARRTSSMEDVPKSSNSTLLTTPRTSLATMVARARGSGVVFIA
jgi:hypothetical protein